MLSFRKWNIYDGEYLLTCARVAIIAITVGFTLLAGKYMKFSATGLGNMIPIKLSKVLFLPALFNGKHQSPLPGSKFLFYVMITF